MAARIARHQSDRAARVPGLQTVEEPLALAATISRLSCPHTLLLVDCLNLWLTNMLMPMPPQEAYSPDYIHAQTAALQAALAQAPRPGGFCQQRNRFGPDSAGACGAPVCR